MNEMRKAILRGIARGERAFAAGRVTTHAAAKRRMRRWLKAKRPR